MHAQHQYFTDYFVYNFYGLHGLSAWEIKGKLIDGSFQQLCQDNLLDKHFRKL